MRCYENLIIVDDNDARCHKLQTILNFIGQKYSVTKSLNWKKNSLKDARAILIGADKSIPRNLQIIEELFPTIPVILIGKFFLNTKPPSNVVAQLAFPFTYAQLLGALHQCQISKEARCYYENLAHQQQLPLFHSLVGNSEAMRHVRKLITQVASTDASVLILGESGTGKEVVARNIHKLSIRTHKPFIPINCGAIPAELLETELFGHEKGAFTGAVGLRQGRFELAEGGTLFLDEIGDMPFAMQVKLLRVLQERCFERVGSNKTVMVNVRIIAATHKNLEQAIKESSFREDLFYRLNVFPIVMPPLRARKEDLSLLLNELISRLEGENRPSVHLLPSAIEALIRYDWPGNIRELANLVERLTILFPNGIVDLKDLPCRFKQIKFKSEGVRIKQNDVMEMIFPDPVLEDGINLKEHLSRTELALINQALHEADWVVARAASYLNMRRTTLVEKMRKYGLTRPEQAL